MRGRPRWGGWDRGALAGGPGVEEAPFGELEIVGDHDAAIAPAAADERPAPQARGFHADQELDQKIHGRARRRSDSDAEQADHQEGDGDEINDQHQPQPPPDHPQRTEQERSEAEPFAKKYEPVRMVGGAALAHRRLEYRIGWHDLVLDDRGCPVATAQVPAAGQPSEPLVEGTASLVRGSIATATLS